MSFNNVMLSRVLTRESLLKTLISGWQKGKGIKAGILKVGVLEFQFEVCK